MALDKEQFQDLIERKLKEINMHSGAAVHLLLGTAAQESGFGTYLRQVGGGPALGVFQMEPATEKDIWNNYLDVEFREDLAFAVWRACYVSCANPEALEYNLAYQIVMARIHYRRIKEPLPPHDNVEALARYWKKYFNTPYGAGREDEFVRNYKKYVGDIKR